MTPSLIITIPHHCLETPWTLCLALPPIVLPCLAFSLPFPALLCFYLALPLSHSPFFVFLSISALRYLSCSTSLPSLVIPSLDVPSFTLSHLDFFCFTLISNAIPFFLSWPSSPALCFPCVKSNCLLLSFVTLPDFHLLLIASCLARPCVSFLWFPFLFPGASLLCLHILPHAIRSLPSFAFPYLAFTGLTFLGHFLQFLLFLSLTSSAFLYPCFAFLSIRFLTLP